MKILKRFKLLFMPTWKDIQETRNDKERVV